MCTNPKPYVSLCYDWLHWVRNRVATVPPQWPDELQPRSCRQREDLYDTGARDSFRASRFAPAHHGGKGWHIMASNQTASKQHPLKNMQLLSIMNRCNLTYWGRSCERTFRVITYLMSSWFRFVEIPPGFHRPKHAQTFALQDIFTRIQDGRNSTNEFSVTISYLEKRPQGMRALVPGSKRHGVNCNG